MDHISIVQAQNSNALKVLEKIHGQWDQFLKTLSGFNRQEKADFLKKLIIDNQFIEPFSDKVPLFYETHEDVMTLMDLRHQAVSVFAFIERALFDLDAMGIYAYNYRGEQECPVYIFNEDLDNISAHLKKKIEKLPLLD